MMAILGLGYNQVKGEIVTIMIGLRHESRQNFRDQRRDIHKELCTILVDLYFI